MRETSLYPVHPDIFTGTYPRTHYPSVSLLLAYTDLHAIGCMDIAYRFLVGSLVPCNGTRIFSPLEQSFPSGLEIWTDPLW